MPAVGALLRARLQPLMSSHRLLFYAFLSLTAIAITTLSAMRTYNNFYSVAIHLSRSSRSLLVLANFGIFLAFASGRILQTILFGPLLPAEVERLYDRTWFFITESLLAFTIFRDDFDVPFGIMFGFLLFIKCFHWLLADRIEWMDQRPYPGPPPLFHIRVLTLFTLLGLTDAIMLAFTVESTLRYGVGATVLFANEYAILFASVANAVSKYSLAIIELRRAATRGGANAPPWEAKSTYIFYIELITGKHFTKLTTYLTFFVVIMTFYGLPLNIIRDVYMTGHSFITRLTAFYRYRTATRDMDQRYPNATEEELSGEADKTCIICREEMTLTQPDAPTHSPEEGPNMTPKKLPCGHIFHFHCLRSWLERQQNCPTCRRTVLETGAARPQPGAVPQAPNNGLQAPPPFANNANRRPNNQNRIRRAMDILLGAAAQPPMVPGQFANGPLPARFAGPDAAGGHVPPGPRAPPVPGAQRAPALVFEYNYVWDPNTRAPILMQPPMLQGFYREDGLWQGWPGGLQQLPPGTPGAGPGQVPATPAVQAPTPEALNNGPVSQPPSQPSPGATPVPNAGWQAVATNTTASQAMAPPTSENSTPARSSTRDAAALAALRRSGITSPNVPSPLSRSPSMTGSSDGGGLSPQDGVPPPASSTSTSTPSSGSATGPSSFTNGPGMNQTPTPVSRPATPRDAAAMAALRRFGGPATPIMSPSSSQPVASGQPMQASSSSPVNVQDSMSAPPTPTRTTQAPTPQRVALPSLIPLYDFGRPMPRLAQRPPQGGGFIMPPLPPPSPPNGSITNLIPPDHPHYPFVQARAAGMATPGMMTPTLSFPAQPRTPLASLPTTITDEQLQRLDGTTREAIDERIKVLEDVGAAVDRCTEELLRLRSVLPSASSPIAPSPTSSSWPPPTDKGKGVDPSERSSQPSLSVPPTQESRLPSTLTSTTSLAPTAPTPVSTSAAAPRQASLAATVASQMTALGALATTHPTQAQVPVLRLPVNSNPVAASADVTLPPEPTLNTESGAVPLAVADPTLEQAAAQNLEGERVLPNIGGQVVSSEEESESEEEDSE